MCIVCMYYVLAVILQTYFFIYAVCPHNVAVATSLILPFPKDTLVLQQLAYLGVINLDILH